MKPILLIGAALMTGLLASAADRPRKLNEPPRVDTNGLRGMWVVQSVQIDGQPVHGQVGRQPGDIITIGAAGPFAEQDVVAINGQVPDPVPRLGNVVAIKGHVPNPVPRPGAVIFL